MGLQLETKSSGSVPSPHSPVITPTEKRTPSEGNKSLEALPFREEGDDEERVKVKAFHQQPGVVGHDAVLEESHDQLTAHLDRERQVSPRLGNSELLSASPPNEATGIDRGRVAEQVSMGSWPSPVAFHSQKPRPTEFSRKWKPTWQQTQARRLTGHQRSRKCIQTRDLAATTEAVSDRAQDPSSSFADEHTGGQKERDF